MYEIARHRLDEMESWTAEKYELLAELQWVRLGEAIANAERVWPEYGNGSWDEVRRLAGEDDDNRLIAFLSEDRGCRCEYPVDEACHSLAKLYVEAARILRANGVSSEEELPDPDRQMFRRWLEVGEGVAPCPRYDLNEAVFVPIPEGATDRMLNLLYPDYTPSELHEAAKEGRGEADFMAIDERREIEAMTAGLQAQFGRRPNPEERMREHLRVGLTAGLAGDARDSSWPGYSDWRLIAVSKRVLTSIEHDKLMTEIETKFAGWCRECGTMPGLVGCSVCPPGRQSVGTSLVSEGAPF